MRFVLLLFIQIYWQCIPPKKRRRCLHRVTCSRYVYSELQLNGLRAGLVAFLKRWKSCRPGYLPVYLQKENLLFLHLKNGAVLTEPEISDALIKLYKTGL